MDEEDTFQIQNLQIDHMVHREASYDQNIQTLPLAHKVHMDYKEVSCNQSQSDQIPKVYKVRKVHTVAFQIHIQIFPLVHKEVSYVQIQILSLVCKVHKEFFHKALFLIWIHMDCIYNLPSYIESNSFQVVQLDCHSLVFVDIVLDKDISFDTVSLWIRMVYIDLRRWSIFYFDLQFHWHMDRNFGWIEDNPNLWVLPSTFLLPFSSKTFYNEVQTDVFFSESLSCILGILKDLDFVLQLSLVFLLWNYTKDISYTLFF